MTLTFSNMLVQESQGMSNYLGQGSSSICVVLENSGMSFTSLLYINFI